MKSRNLRYIEPEQWEAEQAIALADGRRLCAETLRRDDRHTPTIATQLDQRVAQLESKGWTIQGSGSVPGIGVVELQYWRPVKP